MKRIIFIPLLTFLLASTLSFAQENSKTRFGFGWYSLSAPIGGRVLINNNVIKEQERFKGSHHVCPK